MDELTELEIPEWLIILQYELEEELKKINNVECVTANVTK